MKKQLAKLFTILCLLLTTTSNYAQQGGACSPEGKLSPHPYFCEYFFQCSNGEFLLQECPPGLHFNPVLEVCDWSENAGCTVNVNLPGGPGITCNNGGYGQCYTLETTEVSGNPGNGTINVKCHCNFTGVQTNNCSLMMALYCMF